MMSGWAKPDLDEYGRKHVLDAPAEVFAFPDGCARIIRSHKLTESDLERAKEIAALAKNLGVYIDAEIYSGEKPAIDCVYTHPENWTEVTKPAPGLMKDTKVRAIPESLPYSLYNFEGCSTAEKSDRIFLASVISLEDEISQVGSYAKYFLDLFIERARSGILNSYQRFCELEGPALLPKVDFQELLKVVTLYETYDRGFSAYRMYAEVSAFVARLLKYHLLSPYTDFMPELSVPGGIVACRCISLSNSKDAATVAHHQKLNEFIETSGRNPSHSEKVAMWYDSALYSRSELDKMQSLWDEVVSRLSKQGAYSFWFPEKVDEWMNGVGSKFPITRVIEKRLSDRRSRIEANLPFFLI